MHSLYLTYDEDAEGGEVCEGEEDSSWPSYEPTYKYVTFLKFYRRKPKDRFFYERVEIDKELFHKEELYLAWITYADGDTFSTTYGNTYIVGAYATRGEAKDAVDEALNNTKGYKPWEGFFSKYDDYHIEKLEVLCY